MVRKKDLLMLAAAAALSLGLTAGALAAEPNRFSVAADELEYDIASGEGEARGSVVIADELGTATGDYARFNSKTKSGLLRGSVVADREDAHITCEEFIAHNENDVTAQGGAVLTKDGKSLHADRVDYFKLRGYAETVGSWARLTDADGSVMNASKIDYDMNSGLAHAYDGVTFESPARKMSGSADNAVYDSKAGGTVELIGNAQAVQDGNSVRGNKLRLTNSSVASADGGVRIIYIPEQRPAGGEAKDAKSAEGSAGAEAAGVQPAEAQPRELA